MRSIARSSMSTMLLSVAFLFASAPGAPADPSTFFDGTFEPYEVPFPKFGAYTGAIAVGDLNGDGRADAAMVFNGVIVFLSRGAVGFQDPVTYGAATSYERVALGDLNGDGALDVAATTASTVGVRVFLNDGHGVLGAPFSLDVGTGCQDVAIGDLDGDGFGDVVVARNVSTALLLLGHGDGTFGSPMPITTTSGNYASSNERRVALGDLDGDTKLDAVFNRNTWGADVLIGHGDGTFDPSRVLGTAPYLEDVRLVDFSGDSRPEIVTSAYGEVQVTTFNPNRTFGSAAYLAVDGYAKEVTGGDLDGDGIADLVTVIEFDHILNLWRGDGVGGFGPRVTVPTAYYARSIGIGDRDADGRADVFAFGSPPRTGLFAGMSVTPGRPDIFDPPGWVPSNLATAEVSAADLNHDGRQDLVGSEDRYVAIALQGSGGTFTPSAFYSTYSLGPIATGLINDDVIPDLFLGTSPYLKIYFGNGNGTFASPSLMYIGDVITRVAIADIDRDGKMDLAALSGREVHWKLNALPTPFSTGAVSHYDTGLSADPPTFAIASVDFDPYPDIVVPDPAGDRVLIAHGTSAGGFEAPTFIDGVDGASCVAVGYINDDTAPDLLVGAAGYRAGDAPQMIHVFLGDGVGGFTAGASYPAGNAPADVDLVDLDGDGDLDAVVTNAFANTVSVWFGNNDGTFADRRDYGAGAEPVNCAVANLAGDAKPDLVTGSSSSGFFILENLGSERVSAPVSPRPSRLSFGVRPNPSVTGAYASIRLPADGPVVLETYDIGGRRVAVQRLDLKAGAHEIALDGLGGLPTGLYVIRLRQRSLDATARICLMH